MVKKQAQFQILQVLIDSYWISSKLQQNIEEDIVFFEAKDLTDYQNAIFEHLLYNMDYNCELDEEMSSYMLRATDMEAANYYSKVFLPKFKIQYLK